ncbi:polyprenyl synthetase family protein [Bacteroides sp. 519]|uniref:polyprenyl synthetase family protein n=1 Tax=Bacteroides sp. 519 TaxID=2302937 RepID=UPI0013D20840|nr:polyprenyl synthetase family protein [Bacteroides sp. 519]NDV58687.1 polyprenyl synthetase family protein [Bacteroides sp. 519]
MFTANQMQNEINKYVAELPVLRHPEELYKPIEYILSLGGKRIRPLLMLMAYNLYKDDVQTVLAPAAGIEIFHNYTLLHDDLMDKADMRRGKKTVHKLWDDNTAILSGDAMFVLAYQYMAKSVKHQSKMWDIFNSTALEICEGQQFDINFEKRNDVAEEEYLEMIRLKTAVLLAASMKMGAIQADASEKDAELLYDFGINIGLAFQLKDDYLDIYGDPAIFGKNIGGDILANKKTYLLIKAFQLANEKQKQELNQWIYQPTTNPEAKISAVISIYNQLDVKTVCENSILGYYNVAMDIFERVSVDDDRKQEMKNLINDLMYREK